MMKQNTCFKGDGGSRIDLIIKNSKFLFIKTNPFETGLSDHHHMIYTILKTKFEKFEPKKSIYRNFKQYDGGKFDIGYFQYYFCSENPCSLWKYFCFNLR